MILLWGLGVIIRMYLTFNSGDLGQLSLIVITQMLDMPSKLVRMPGACRPY